MSISRHIQRRGARATEKQVQAAVERLYRLFGCVVNNLSQPRATMQTPGIPDLYVQCPKRGLSFWHETKTSSGRLSAAQVAFRDREAACRRVVVVGGVAEAKQQLARCGLTVEAA